MANKFSQTRKYFWRGLEFIADYAQDGGKILDFGCGNGRLLELFSGKNIDYTGVDISEKLVDIAKGKYPEMANSFQKISSSGSLSHTNIIRMNYNNVNDNFQDYGKKYNRKEKLVWGLPFSDNSFNAVYSIAVFHHFPSQKYREDVVRELYRITKKDGYIIITVWNLWPVSTHGDHSSTRGRQKKYIKNIVKNWFNKLTGKSSLDWNDCYISFSDNDGNKFQRFHHAFTKRELKKLFSEAGFKVEKCEVFNEKNILLIGKK